MKKVGTCQLCLQRDVGLCRSHIISEFLYKSIYDEKHGAIEIHGTGAQRKSKRRETGMWDYLLCEGCEKRRNKWENHVDKLKMFNEHEELFTLQALGGEERKLTNVRCYRSFKLFHMSILWMMAISERFENVWLSSRIQEDLRNRIDKEEPGEEYEYGCAFAELIRDEKERLTHVALFPRAMGEIKGHQCCILLIAGYLWVFFITAEKVGMPWQEGFVQKNDTLLFVEGDPRKEGIRLLFDEYDALLDMPQPIDRFVDR